MGEINLAMYHDRKAHQCQRCFVRGSLKQQVNGHGFLNEEADFQVVCRSRKLRNKVERGTVVKLQNRRTC